MVLPFHIDDVSTLIRQVAREELLPRHGRLRADQVHLHSDGSLFTEADLLCETRLSQGLTRIFADAIMLGEEKISEKPQYFLSQAKDISGWVIDPIDGTGAFKRGEDTYGVIVALVVSGETVASWIYTPGHAMLSADGRLCPATDLMIVAEKGSGCFIEDHRVSLIGRPETLEAATVAFACRNQDAGYEPILAEGVAGYVPRNNSSHDYTLLLTGRVDANFYSEGHTPQGLGKCPPWDHAAGVLMVTEAGGHAALPYGGDHGQTYTPLACHNQLLAAANRELFADVQRHVQDRAPLLCRPGVLSGWTEPAFAP